MDNSYYPPALEVLAKLVKENGINPDKLFKPHHINIKELKKTNNRIKAATVDNLWKDAESLVGNSAFALNAYKYWHPSYMGALGYAWLSSRTLREGFIRLVRYIKILNSQAGMKIEESENIVTISFEKHFNIAQSAFAMSTLMHMCKVNYQDKLEPTKVTFWHPKPKDTSKYDDYFQCPIRFNTGIDSISFPLHIVDEELSGGNAQLAKLNDQVMIKYLKLLGQDSFLIQLKAIIVKNLPTGNVSTVLVAEELYLSNRSLQRKLHELGTTFKKEFEKCRRDLAEIYINEAKMSLTEISFVLGFTEISSFSRSYKRWTGHSPNTDRQEVLKY